MRGLLNRNFRNFRLDLFGRLRSLHILHFHHFLMIEFMISHSDCKVNALLDRQLLKKRGFIFENLMAIQKNKRNLFFLYRSGWLRSASEAKDIRKKS